MRRVTRALAAIALAAAVWALAAMAEAQEIQVVGPLAGGQRPAIVHGKKPYRVRRLHVALDLATPLRSELQRAVLPGLHVTYHFTEWLGVGVWAAHAFQASTSFADGLQARIDAGTCARAPGSPGCAADAASVTRPGTNADGTRRTGRLADDQLGRFTWLLAPQLTLAPLRGKIVALDPSLLLGIGVDATLSLGAAVVGLRERTPCAAGRCADQFSLSNRVAAAPFIGAGLAFHPALFMSFGVEGRFLPFAWNPSGFDVRGHRGDAPDGAVDAADRTLAVNAMVAVFVAAHLPPAGPLR
jgi:hypothetical protein